MRNRVLLMLLATVALYVGSCPGAWADMPDLSAMVTLVGRWGMGHACPVGPRALYTAGHMTDERPFDLNIPLYPSRMEQDGQEDIAVPVGVDDASDAALMRPRALTLRYFPRVTEPPKPGERLWDTGWIFDSRKEFGHARIIDAKVTRVVAGHVFLSASAGPGSSGSCWVNAKGEAVAINVGSMDCDAGPACAVAVGLWGPWRFETEDKSDDVAPRISVPDVVDSPLGHAVNGGYQSRILPIGQSSLDLTHGRLCEARRSVPASAAVAIGLLSGAAALPLPYPVHVGVDGIANPDEGSPLLNHIGTVVGLSAEEEMRRIDAGRIVTAMQDEQPCWDRSVNQHPCDPVRALYAAGPKAETPVPAGLPVAPPRPARSGLPAFDLCPEATFDRLFDSHSAPLMQVGEGPVRGSKPLSVPFILPRCGVTRGPADIAREHLRRIDQARVEAREKP